MNPTLEWKLHNLPDSPGCYLMKSEGKIIYVGKAKNLKNRVSQYFHASRAHTPKVRAMVEKIDDFDIMLVDGEMEAFALECNLIKLHRPRYNILLKDDKHYPYIRIDPHEDFPRPELVRRQAKDGAKYFGPYQGSTVVREVLDVVRMSFPIRSCTQRIDPDKPRRPCVYHQIGQCLAPCAGLVSKEDYAQLTARVIEFLGGKHTPVIEELTRQMNEASAQMNYERAALYRDRIRAVQAVMQKQKAISTSPDDRDVIAVLPRDADALVELLFIRGGRLIGSENFTMEGAGDEDTGETVTQFLLQYYSADNLPPTEILVCAEPPEKPVIEQLLTELLGRRVYIYAPMRGEKLKLVRMAYKNARDLAEKLDKKAAASRARTVGAVEELAEVLGLDHYPRRIEGYDISNTQGTLSVGSEVVMIDGVSRNDQYRIYRIKTVQGANDFASMHEVITRRLRHGLKELEEQREAERNQYNNEETDAEADPEGSPRRGAVTAQAVTEGSTPSPDDTDASSEAPANPNGSPRRGAVAAPVAPNGFPRTETVAAQAVTEGLTPSPDDTDALPEYQPPSGKFSDLPDLILIDGGRGQLNAALDAMHALGLNIPMFGLAKRIEEIVLPDSDESILLDRHSNALHLIQRLRDEAHRFAISHHRQLRGKASVASRLETVKGVGEARRKALLKHFATVEALKQASVDEIATVVPRNVAENVYAMLHEDG